MTEKEYAELADLLYPQVVDTAFYFDKYKARKVASWILEIITKAKELSNE